MLDRMQHNYPEGYKEKPWCPHTQLVQIGAALAGVELTPETFCTETVDTPIFPGMSVHYSESSNFSPKASCAKINKILIEQLKEIKKTVKLPTDKEVTTKIDNAKDLAAKTKIFESYKIKKDKYNKRQVIADRWRKVIFETCYSTTADEKNPHFRQLETADDLTEEEIINNVRHFSEALEKIIGFKRETLSWWSDEADNCKQSPRRHHLGPIH